MIFVSHQEMEEREIGPPLLGLSGMKKGESVFLMEAVLER